MAKGQGLGVSGGDLLAAARGACFWNDLCRFSGESGGGFNAKMVTVSVAFTGEPARATAAEISADLEVEDDAKASLTFERACQEATISQSLQRRWISAFAECSACVLGIGYGDLD